MGQLAQNRATCDIHGEYTPKVSQLCGQATISGCPVCARDVLKNIHKGVKLKLSTTRPVYGLPARYQVCHFDILTGKVPGLDQVAVKLKSFCQNFSKLDANWPPFVVLSLQRYNNTMACAVLNSLAAQGRTCGYTTASDFLMAVRSTYSNEGVDEQAIIAKYSEFDCLVIEGIENTRNSTDDKFLLSLLLDRRYKAVKPTILLSQGDLYSVTDRLNSQVAEVLTERKVMYSLQAAR